MNQASIAACSCAPAVHSVFELHQKSRRTLLQGVMCYELRLVFIVTMKLIVRALGLMLVIASQCRGQKGFFFSGVGVLVTVVLAVQ